LGLRERKGEKIAEVYDRRVDDVSAYILAGGRSTRMGKDKAFLEFDGSTLLARAIGLAKEVTDQVMIVGERSKFSAWGTVVEDVYKDRGPLGAIHAALKASATEWNLVMAVDMPFLEAAFVKWLVDKACVEKAMVTVPRAERGLQPLCGVYGRNFAAVAERSLEAGKKKIDPLFAEVETRIIEEDEVRRGGFPAGMFRNLNTPEEWRRAVAGNRGSES